jgi:hypothetical protein
MPIITKPSPLEKDATGVFSLDKTALALHPIVVASSHFSSPNVWDKIIVKYKSETLGQFESIEFDATIASPEGQFFVSETAEDIFEVEKITIIDKDGAILLIPRAELTIAEFDIDFNPAAPQIGNPIIWDTFLSGAIAEADGGISGGAGNNMIKSNASKVLNGADFKVTYNFTMIPGSDDLNLVHGIMNSTSDTGFAGLTGITYQSSNDILIYDNYSGAGAPQATFSNSMMNQNGSNTAIFEKVGNVLTIKMNGVTIYTKNNHTEQTMVPAVRTWAIQAIDSGYMLSSANTIQAVTWNVAGKTGAGTVTTGANGLITKATGGSGYNVNVLSNETITGDGYVEFIWSHTNVVFGLAETNEPNGSYTNTIYGGYNAGGGWEITNIGAYNGSSLQNNSLVVGDVIKIERVGNLYKSFKNNLLMHTCNINNTNPLKATVCIYSQTNGVNGATISL